VPVEVSTAASGSIARSLTVSGIVEPIRTVGVNSQLSGAILSLHAEEGDDVEKGDVLARLDDREIQLQLDAAEAALQVAESAFERAKQLRERKVITLPEYERDRTAYAAAKAQRDQLQTRLEYATVTAPITGIVTEKRVEAGDVVAPQTRLFTLADVSTRVVRVQVSELDVVDLHAGDPVAVALDAFPDRPFQGRIRRIFPAADPTTRLVPVEVALEGEDSRMARPGFLARTTFALGIHRNVLLVPASALVRGTGSQAVFVVEEGKAVRRTVTPGLVSQGRVEITEGLSPGDVVVTLGNNALEDGSPVRVVEGAGEAQADSTRVPEEG
jgi:membrane fusion protein (multidrug efflux system)